MNWDRDLQDRFDSAGSEIELEPGSADAVRGLAARRTRNARVVTGVAAVVAVAGLFGALGVLPGLLREPAKVESVGESEFGEQDSDRGERANGADDDGGDSDSDGGDPADAGPTASAPVVEVDPTADAASESDESDGADESDGSSDADDSQEPDGSDGSEGSDSATGGTGPMTEADFTYLGAFLAPAGEIGDSTFAYGGEAAAFNPAGDPRGRDGFDGSLFLSGHPRINPGVAEITIPAPALPGGSTAGLPVAEVLQPFADPTGGRAAEYVADNGDGQDEFRFSGLEVIDGPTGPRLHWSVWQYNNVTGNDPPGHGHSSIDLSNPDPAGPYHLDRFNGRATAGYLVEVPERFATDALGGRNMLSGLRDGAGDNPLSQGPPFYAHTPPADANPGARIDATELAAYDGGRDLPGYGEADATAGAAWVTTSGGAEAIVTVGLRGLGEPINGEPREQDCGINAGPHAGPYEPQVLFYDPADLARAAAGELEPSEIRPYRSWNPSEHLIPTCTWRLTSISFDEDSGRIYVVQHKADTSQNRFDPVPVIHVFQT